MEPIEQIAAEAQAIDTDASTIVDRFPAVRQQLEALVVREVEPIQQWYARRVPGMGRRFRFVGVSIIVLSGSMPLLASADYPNKTLILSIVGVSIAILSGIAGFFRFEQSWHLFTATQLRIERLIGEWRLTMVEAEVLGGAKGTELAIVATRSLVETVRTVVEQEAETFLKDLQVPSSERH